MDTNMIAFGYCRVSTVGQATDGVSLDAQREKIRAWANVNDYELAGVFVDAGLSGGRADNRPQLQAALDAVCKAKGVLVVYSLSRLARSTKDTIGISERLDRAGADLVSLSEKIDTTTAAGKMVFRMLAVLAEFEKDQISERTKTALSYKRGNGERISGQLPFGYRLDEDQTHLVEDPSEQKIIQQILTLRAEGYSYKAIVDQLTLRGITPTRGAKWHVQTIFDIVKKAS